MTDMLRLAQTSTQPGSGPSVLQSRKLRGLGRPRQVPTFTRFTESRRVDPRQSDSQVDLMERYPEHRFSATSAAQYDWLEQLYPPLFDKVKSKIETGQFGVIGATWGPYPLAKS